MIVGHYAASFAAKAVRPEIPLWHLILASQLIDFAWASFVLTGIEQARIVPGYTRAVPLDLYYMPFSHSLIALVPWYLLTWLLYPRLVKKALPGAAIVVAVVVASHWFLDLIVHSHDLWVYSTHKAGFGLWNYPIPAVLLEVGIVVAAFGWYAFKIRMNSERVWHYDVLMIGTIVATYAFFYFELYPQSIVAFSSSVLISYTLITWLSWWLETKKRPPRLTDLKISK